MSLGRQGTTCLIDMMNPHHLLPVNNYQFGTDDRSKEVSGKVFENTIFQQKQPMDKHSYGLMEHQKNALILYLLPK